MGFGGNSTALWISTRVERGMALEKRPGILRASDPHGVVPVSVGGDHPVRCRGVDAEPLGSERVAALGIELGDALERDVVVLVEVERKSRPLPCGGKPRLRHVSSSDMDKVVRRSRPRASIRCRKGAETGAEKLGRL